MSTQSTEVPIEGAHEDKLVRHTEKKNNSMSARTSEFSRDQVCLSPCRSQGEAREAASRLRGDPLPTPTTCTGSTCHLRAFQSSSNPHPWEEPHPPSEACTSVSFLCPQKGALPTATEGEAAPWTRSLCVSGAFTPTIFMTRINFLSISSLTSQAGLETLSSLCVLLLLRVVGDHGKASGTSCTSWVLLLPAQSQCRLYCLPAPLSHFLSCSESNCTFNIQPYLSSFSFTWAFFSLCSVDTSLLPPTLLGSCCFCHLDDSFLSLMHQRMPLHPNSAQISHLPGSHVSPNLTPTSSPFCLYSTLASNLWLRS